MDFTVKKGFEKGSQKVLTEYTPLGVRPMGGLQENPIRDYRKIFWGNAIVPVGL